MYCADFFGTNVCLIAGTVAGGLVIFVTVIVAIIVCCKRCRGGNSDREERETGASEPLMTQPSDPEDTAYDYLTQDTDEWDYFIKVNTNVVFINQAISKYIHI